MSLHVRSVVILIICKYCQCVRFCTDRVATIKWIKGAFLGRVFDPGKKTLEWFNVWTQSWFMPKLLDLALCCAALCCAVLCCAVLCCPALSCAVQCCPALCCAVQCCAVLCCAVLWCAVLCSAVLRCAVLCCAVVLRCGAARCGAGAELCWNCFIIPTVLIV